VLAALEPVTHAYVDAPGDPRVGFIAEDVPALVARPGRTTLSALEIGRAITRRLKGTLPGFGARPWSQRDRQRARVSGRHHG
jgi:hypothetical protein